MNTNDHIQNPGTFQGTERELTSMTRELDELHNDVGMPAMWQGVERMVEGLRSGASKNASSRRTFLMGAGATLAGGAALIGAGLPSMAGAATRPTKSSSASALAFPPANLKGDLVVAAVAASLENLAVFAYTAGLGAATAGKLGTVPPAVATFATTARAQHSQHAAAWNAVLRANGKAKVTVTNPTLTPVVQGDFAKVTDITGLAKLALTLETIAAETYQVETSKLMSKAAIELSASIEPVEMQHIAILYYVLGMYPGAQTASGMTLAFSATNQAV
ncbi:MAG: ferritin-like domain-containing protein [Acidobacteriota bacterium]|nr:ferritin-like domain-containing protein [Acidobacteriota bacterium]MDE3043505.1 ferritin-like domain-containing protein [Acidobacteriota bacterium]MDE3106824.1 ferritin-like domain-containing protein [Acidobacteriota bacterium]MDE3222957.1 ferritin-like domain-containing protein [Acidobacteriota bacterium]